MKRLTGSEPTEPSRMLRFLCGIALLLVLLSHKNATATTLARMSLEKMTVTSPLIVRARCIVNSTGWDAGEIWTFTNFDVEEIWRGSAPPEITVRLLGGRLGNLTSTVSGVPRFQPGEEAILFLEPTPRGDFSVTSWAQGTLRIRRDPRTGEENATQDSASMETFDPATRRFEAAGIRNLALGNLRHALTRRCATPGAPHEKTPAIAMASLISISAAVGPPASGYVADTTLPSSGGCPSRPLEPVGRRSTDAPVEHLLPGPQTLLTSASGGAAQLDEIESVISDSFGAWSGVTGTTFNRDAYPGALAPVVRVSAANSCTDDAENNVDGVNTICFNQSSIGFTSGVLAFTRVITANAPGVSVGSSAPAAFAGQILDADTLVRNDGQSSFATPAALAPRRPPAHTISKQF